VERLDQEIEAFLSFLASSSREKAAKKRNAQIRNFHRRGAKFAQLIAVE